MNDDSFWGDCVGIRDADFIELGPRGNGKSYTFSEFSPYATLLGAPTSAATLFWNAQPLGAGYDQRDQTAVLKTVCAGQDPNAEEVEEYLEYAIEGRRRVKEQLNKRKPDEEFANINLSFLKASGEEVVVFCPESKRAQATQKPVRPVVAETIVAERTTAATPASTEAAVSLQSPGQPNAKARHYRIHYGATGYSYETIFKDYLPGSADITVEDPYIRAYHQIVNFLRFCETAVKCN